LSNVEGREIPRYDIYIMKPEEFVLTLAGAMAFCFSVGLIFYENLVLSTLFSLVGILYIPIRKKEQLKKRKDALTLQFKDTLYFISVSLSAGKSLETSIAEAYKSIRGIYPDPECDIVRELEIMNRRLLMNDPVEKIFMDLADRSGAEDIKSFAQVILISKRAGANLVEVIKNTSDTIREKVEIHQDIQSMIAGKRLEQKILGIMPFILVLFLKTGSNYLEPLMTTAFGRVVMTVALLMILTGQFIAHKIMSIEV
jgi:tight adherence protein B